MKNDATNGISFNIRILILMVCCVLFLPLQGQSSEKNEMESFRTATLAMAVSGISNPVSQLKTLADSDNTSLRSPGKRQQNVSAGVDDGVTSASLPALPPLPEFRLCAEKHFELRSRPPESHGLIHWFSLAPPSSQNVW